MARALAAVAFLCSLVCPAAAAKLDAASINDAAFHARPADDKIDPTIVKAQVLLDRALFSPGEIDGKFAENTQKALKAFADANGLNFQKVLTGEVWSKLAEISQDLIVTQYTISEADVKGPFLHRLPTKMEDMKTLEALAFASPREALAEKFHMSEGLLAALNPDKSFDRAGEVIQVMNVGQHPKLTIGRLEVDKVLQTVKAFDPQNMLLAVFPATVGSTDKPTPSGTLTVISSDANPTYRYNPDYKFRGVRSKRPFKIRPGPNNPVGSYWIGLSAEGYGIHGTPAPGKISKSESHGCVRLTNWDADLLGISVKKGTPVDFVDGKLADRRS
jgi:lipoprotein-anchoring transpeptidase ErfK/SrfK